MQGKEGLILLDKPTGTTSFGALSALKKTLGTKKVGHTGTLDRFAEGLLIALSGRLTRLAPYFLSLEKEYIASVWFGLETDTLDPEGSVCRKGEVPDLDRITQSLNAFKGEIDQVPPDYSAVHLKGKRAYKLARGGVALAIAARKVFVHRIVILSYDPPELILRIRCSKGTYIRSIARDLGREAGTCAYLSSLKRVAIGRFRLRDAVKPLDFDPSLHIQKPAEFVKQIPSLEAKRIKSEAVSDIRHGVPPGDTVFENPPQSDGEFALFDGEGRLLAVTRRELGRYSYRAVIAGGV
jgi:tRNA pseudouridine55 synthase